MSVALNLRIQSRPSPRTWRLRCILLNKKSLPTSETLSTPPLARPALESWPSLGYYSNQFRPTIPSRMAAEECLEQPFQSVVGSSDRIVGRLRAGRSRPAPIVSPDRLQRCHPVFLVGLRHCRVPSACAARSGTHAAVLVPHHPRHFFLAYLSTALDLLRGHSAPRRARPLCRGHHSLHAYRPADGRARPASPRAPGRICRSDWTP